jgi:tRNA(fMet)-specific endonuclease VapC
MGEKTGNRDPIVAAHALALGAVMITANESESSRAPGLRAQNRETA